MRKNTMVAMLLTMVMLFMVVAPAMAVPIGDDRNVVRYVLDEIDQLWSNNKMSNDDIYGLYVDISQIANRTVTATVYEGAYQVTRTTAHTNITPQPINGANGANDKLSRFLHYFGNNNRDVIVVAKGYIPDDTVIGFVYGERKSEIINAYVAGIPECLEQNRLYDDSGDSGNSGDSTKTATSEVNPDAWAGKYLATTFTIGTTTYSVLDIKGDTVETTKPEVKSMDVAPYIKGDRTYVPVRYLAYSLGVSEDGVTWDGNTRQVGITRGDTQINLTIDSPLMTVNKKTVTMDVAPEITSDRTFLPARWISEALGAQVEWDNTTKQAIIKMPITTEPGN